VGWIVGPIAEIPKSQMISMRAGGGASASTSASGARAPAPTATGDHPYRQKNAIPISEMGPISTTYARARQKVTPYANRAERGCLWITWVGR